jgi:tetratricopeptide (TPR) repeat protein
MVADLGDRRIEGIVSANLGILEQERGAAAAARSRYERAIVSLAEIGDRRLLAITMGNLGLLHHEEGRLDDARTSHERAARLLHEVGDRRSEALSLGRLAAALAALDRTDEALAALDRGTRLLESLGDPLALEAVRLAEAFIDLSAARRATVEKREALALAHVEAARRRMTALTAPGPSGAPSLADRSDDIRAGLRILERSLSTMAGASESPSDDALLLAPEARWFRAPAGAWCDLRKRHAARRVLAKLAEHQREARGHGLPLEVLIEAGWPGERVLPDAAANRLYVLLNQLRKLGLRSHLHRTDQGYLLDPTLSVHYVPVEPA